MGGTEEGEWEQEGDRVRGEIKTDMLGVVFDQSGRKILSFFYRTVRVLAVSSLSVNCLNTQHPEFACIL